MPASKAVVLTDRVVLNAKSLARRAD